MSAQDRSDTHAPEAEYQVGARVCEAVVWEVAPGGTHILGPKRKCGGRWWKPIFAPFNPKRLTGLECRSCHATIRI